MRSEGGTDSDLKRRVLALLAADNDPDSLLDKPFAEFNVAETAGLPQPESQDDPVGSKNWIEHFDR